MAKVLQDNELKFEGSEDDCWMYVLKHQGQSVHYATTWGGWEILEQSKVEPE